MSNGHAGQGKHDNTGKHTYCKQNAVTWAHHSPHRTKDLATQPNFGRKTANENNLELKVMLCESAETAKTQKRFHEGDAASKRRWKQKRRTQDAMFQYAVSC